MQKTFKKHFPSTLPLSLQRNKRTHMQKHPSINASCVVQVVKLTFKIILQEVTQFKQNFFVTRVGKGLLLVTGIFKQPSKILNSTI